MSTERDELADLIQDVGEYIPGSHADDYISPTKAADAILAAGYRKVDHIEYAADHALADMEATDEDGALWTDRDDFEDFYEDYARDTTKLLQRHVTAWEPLP